MPHPTTTWYSKRRHSFRMRTRSGLLAEGSTASDSPLLAEFFASYDRAFVLPDEKEEREGFERCLELNEGRAYDELSSRVGEYAEPIVIVRDPDSGRLLAGANFLVAPLREPWPMLTMNLNYIFVDQAGRRGGVFSRLLADLDQIAGELFERRTPDTLPMLIFIEQNDPARMDPHAYALDTAHSGLDQVERLRIWARRGAKLIDFPYVQPPLSSEQRPDPNLLYAVLGVESESLDPRILRQHLALFFGVSVLKGRDPRTEPAAWEQLTQLDRLAREGTKIGLRTFRADEAAATR